MSVIDYPIVTILRSDNKLSGNNSNYSINFNFTYSLNKYRYLHGKLIDIVLPHTISGGVSTDNTYSHCDVRINGVSFLNNCDSNTIGQSIGFFKNKQYSINGTFCIEDVIGYDFIMENPQEKNINVVFNFLDSSGTAVSYTCNINILVFEFKPYFLNDVI